MFHKIPVTIVAAVGKHTRVIGQDNKLIWHVSKDMKRFKALTLGKPIIMGRKTFESIIAILGKPLPGRTNIVVTRQADYQAPAGVLIARTLEEAFALAEKEKPTEIHIGGGAEIYRQALPFVDKLFITWFMSDTPGDTTFPAFETEFTVAVEHPMQIDNGVSYQWVDYIRK